jgi:hypothetical protein
VAIKARAGVSNKYIVFRPHTLHNKIYKIKLKNVELFNVVEQKY